MPVPSEPIAGLVSLRDELMSQHRVLRTLAASVQRSAERAVTDSRSLGSLRADVLQLAHALGRHIVYEERVLSGVLTTVDAWGPRRAELLDEHHQAEHAQMRVALAEAAMSDDAAGAARVTRRTIRELLEHMAAEETDVFAEDVFVDDAYTRDSFGG